MSDDVCRHCLGVDPLTWPDGERYPAAPERPGDRMVVDPAQMPQDWLNAFAEQGVPNWAALQAWNEAADDDTVMQIKARARQIAQTDE